MSSSGSDDAVLRARGYSTFLGPEGPDRGIDILASPDPMGFGGPRGTQVKSGDSPLDRSMLDQLIGAMSKVEATHGLPVSWGGFQSSVDREEATQFFQVRLRDQGDLIGQVLTYYDKPDEEIRTELPPCGRHRVLWTDRKGPNAGGRFRGSEGFPERRAVREA
ncbi:MAG: restriction endonuclease [Gammaproteobacteria bacterium]|nr:restriction endonuclease [Gammaproteobacteria bacterium]